MDSRIIIPKHLNLWNKVCHSTHPERNYSQASQINLVSQLIGAFNLIKCCQKDISSKRDKVKMFLSHFSQKTYPTHTHDKRKDDKNNRRKS